MIEVNPTELDLYADQLQRNANLFADIRAFAVRNCRDTEGMTGILALCAAATEEGADNVRDLANAGGSDLLQVSINLQGAATDYREQDARGAERLLRSYTYDALPVGYTETDDAGHTGDYSDPSELALDSPETSTEFETRIQSARDLLGVIDASSTLYVDIDPTETILDSLSGDWDALSAIASGYARLAGANGIDVIGRNIEYGLDSVSSTWNSPAATNFDFLIRGRWVPAIADFVEYCEYSWHVFETLVHDALGTFDSMLRVIGQYVTSTAETIKEIVYVELANSSAMPNLIARLRTLISTLRARLWRIVAELTQLLQTAVDRLDRTSDSVRSLRELWDGAGDLMSDA